MQKKKLPRDPNSRAAAIVAMSTGQKAPDDLAAMTGAQTGNPPIMQGEMDAAMLLSDPELRKNIMREMGSLGGKKGGAARAKKLSARDRTRIARTAAKARWSKKKQAAPKKAT